MITQKSKFNIQLSGKIEATNLLNRNNKKNEIGEQLQDLQDNTSVFGITFGCFTLVHLHYEFC